MKPNANVEQLSTNGRGAVVELAIELDGVIARAEALNLSMVTYLLRVARDEVSDTLGERARRS